MEQKQEVEEKVAEGTVVAKGKHIVPPGVAVEELDGEAKKLSTIGPPILKNLLEEKELVDTYKTMVETIVSEKNTHRSGWQVPELNGVIDLFRDEFAKKGIRVALCKRKSDSGSFLWLEFIDIAIVGDTYVPQYDVANYSGQIIETVFTKLQFPKGVAVEELKEWGDGRKRLQEKISIFVQQMMEEKDLMDEYRALVEQCVEAGVGSILKEWNIKKLKEIITVHANEFEKKGVSIFICHKQEQIPYVFGVHTEYFRWIEFVDRAKQPNYHPQRDAQTKSEGMWDLLELVPLI